MLTSCRVHARIRQRSDSGFTRCLWPDASRLQTRGEGELSPWTPVTWCMGALMRVGCRRVLLWNALMGNSCHGHSSVVCRHSFIGCVCAAQVQADDAGLMIRTRLSASSQTCIVIARTVAHCRIGAETIIMTPFTMRAMAHDLVAHEKYGCI